MNRLLQGDVGSGKTIVALMSMLLAIDNGYQAALMAPTEILAEQHFSTISAFLKKLNLHIALLTGSTKTADRKVLHEQLKSGEIHILIGTHALIEDVVQFQKLGLVIVDEQHRFGVQQRAKLWLKGRSETEVPHMLIMTATPIPRTLAMTVMETLILLLLMSFLQAVNQSKRFTGLIHLAKRFSILCEGKSPWEDRFMLSTH